MNLLIIALDSAVPTNVSATQALVVAPALNSRLRRWLSDEDAARDRAGRRASAFVELLKRTGIAAEGRVGDADPLLAIADALPSFQADEIVIAARSETSIRVDELMAQAQERFALPIRVAHSPSAATLQTGRNNGRGDGVSRWRTVNYLKGTP